MRLMGVFVGACAALGVIAGGLIIGRVLIFLAGVCLLMAVLFIDFLTEKK